MASDPEPRPVELRTEAERDALVPATYCAAAQDLSTPSETAYLEALPEARATVLRQLVRGLLRGLPAGLPEPIVLSPSSSGLPDAPLPPAFDDAALSCMEHPESCDRLALLAFPASESVLVAPIAATYGYDRLRLADPVTRWTPETHGPVEHPVDLVALLRREGAFSDAAQAGRIEAELAESTANLALARLADRVQERRLRPDGSTGQSVSALPDLPAADAAAALERTVTAGHPFHPSAKIRRGMSAADGLAYAPEFTASIDLRFVAVRSDRALRTWTGDRSLTERLYDAFDDLDESVARALPDGRTREEYAVIPVHPWQYHHVILDRYAPERANGDVVPISGYTHPATPLLNLRTVVPYATDGAAAPPHCKLAIAVQTTNVERTVSPHAVYNGPRVTDLLRSIEAEASLQRLGFLVEPAAACYYPPGGPHPDGEAYDDARHLSGLVRANPYTHRLVDDGARLVPAASFVARSPATGRPLVRDVIERYADTRGTTDVGDATLAFLGEYVDAVVPEQLQLMTAYGVALESHLQNSYVVLDDWRPVATLVRDFGGIRVHHDRLAERGFSIDTYPDSDLDADGRRDLYGKLYYALFQNHLAELVVASVETTPVEESDCWAVVRERCLDAFEGLRADADVPSSRIARDEAALFEQPTVHKALTAMRLQGKRHEYVTSRVSNPLASTAEGAFGTWNPVDSG
jgi:siderophore synthetase component